MFMGKFKSIERWVGFSPLVTESEAIMNSEPGSPFPTMLRNDKTGSQVKDTTLITNFYDPTSTPCSGPTITLSFFAPGGEISIR
jgi:hypothetical protein